MYNVSLTCCGTRVALEECPGNFPNTFEGNCEECGAYWALRDIGEELEELEAELED
jgi:hypothetical protein